MAVVAQFRLRESDKRLESVLLARVQSGDIEAGAELRERFRTRLHERLRHWLWNRQWADDLAAEGADAVRECLGEYKSDRASFNTWANRVAFSSIMKRISKLGLDRNDVRLDELVANLLPAVGGPEHAHIIARLREEVERLEPVRRAVIRGTFFEEKSDPELAVELHLPRRQVCYRRKQALRDLEKRLRDVLAFRFDLKRAFGAIST